VAALLMSGNAIGMNGIMSMLSPSTQVLFLFGASGSEPVFRYGRWWTVLSAGWLHASLLHIFMNMYWVRQMGPAMTEMLGPARTVIIYTVGGVVGFALSSFAGAFLPPIPFLHGAGFTVGASAPVFGLIGALYHYGRTTSSAAKQMAQSIIIQAVLFGTQKYQDAGQLITKLTEVFPEEAKKAQAEMDRQFQSTMQANAAASNPANTGNMANKGKAKQSLHVKHVT